MGFVAHAERRRWAVYADYIRTTDAVAALAKRHGYSTTAVRAHIKRCRGILEHVGMVLVKKEAQDGTAHKQ